MKWKLKRPSKNAVIGYLVIMVITIICATMAHYVVKAAREDCDSRCPCQKEAQHD